MNSSGVGAVLNWGRPLSLETGGARRVSRWHPNWKFQISSFRGGKFLPSKPISPFLGPSAFKPFSEGAWVAAQCHNGPTDVLDGTWYNISARCR